MKIPASLIAVAAGSALFAGRAAAVTIITNTTNVAPTGTAGSVYNPATTGTLIPVSSTDLIQGKLPVITVTGSAGASTTFESSGGESKWTDGSIATVYANGTVNNASNHAAYGTVSATTGVTDRDIYVTYDLGALYNLTQVNAILGWNDSGRDDSSFNLLVSVDGVTYTLVKEYFKPADNTGAITTPVTNLHSFTDDSAGFIASGVRYVQFVFTDADNGNAGVVELDVFGQAVPEPASAMLGLLGSVVLLNRRRRQA